MTPFYAFQRSSAETGGIQFSRVKRTVRQASYFPWKARSNLKVILSNISSQPKRCAVDVCG